MKTAISDNIKNYLTDNKFKILSEDNDGFTMRLKKRNIVYTVIFYLGFITFYSKISDVELNIAERYEIDDFNNFIFLMTKSSRSPMYIMK